MRHWRQCRRNKLLDPSLNPEFTTYKVEIKYERDTQNHKDRSLKVMSGHFQFGDHANLFQHLIKLYKIDVKNFLLVQIFVLWLECYCREYRDKSSAEVSATTEEYLRRTKLQFFDPKLCLFEEMTDIHLFEAIENLKIIKARQNTDLIYAFNDTYLSKYLKKLVNERSRRRAEILAVKKENVYRY